MPRKHKIPNLQAIAQGYRVSTRTVRRWHSKGADVTSFDSVAAHLLTQRAPKTNALKAILQRYETNAKTASRPK